MSASRSPDNSRLDSLRDRAKQRLPNHHFQADRRDPDPTVSDESFPPSCILKVELVF